MIDATGTGVATSGRTGPVIPARLLNPYVGPRAFRRGEPFFGRNEEAAQLVNTMLSSRVVLLHSPSGAGKTSLIQTSVLPEFESRGFQLCMTWEPHASALRVNLPVPDDLEPVNRYVFSVVNGLVGHLVERKDAASMTIEDALNEFSRHHGHGHRQLVVVDQLEEILTLAPGDIEGQTEFFRQLGDALSRERRWGLLSMREDYMGGLDRFRSYLPGQLRSTYRLDLLAEDAALRAIRKPARQRGVTFEKEAAEMLVNDLRRVHPVAGSGLDSSVTLPYVEPVLLQVICYSLFDRLAKKSRGTIDRITVADVEAFRPFDRALSTYYRAVVRDAAGGDVRTEKALREWIGLSLVNGRPSRRPTRTRPAVGDPDAALAALQRWYLVRDDPRPGGTFYELAHDMLVGPILVDNREWFGKNLPRWQLAAYEWQRSGRDSRFLVGGADLLSARSSWKSRLTENEEAFLSASRERSSTSTRTKRLASLLGVFTGLLGISILVNIVLLVLVLRDLK